MVAVIGCVFLGFLILWFWVRPTHSPPKIYMFSAYIIYLVYLEKLKDTKWYQWRKRREIDRWVAAEIEKAKERNEVEYE